MRDPSEVAQSNQSFSHAKPLGFTKGRSSVGGAAEHSLKGQALLTMLVCTPNLVSFIHLDWVGWEE